MRFRARWIGRIAPWLLAGCIDADPRTEPSSTGSTTSASGTTSSTVAASTETTTGTTADATTTSASADSTSTSSDTTSTTGEPATWSYAVRTITAANRHYVEMTGGWGPHLRGLMRASDGATWFVHDAGPDVEHNTAIHYLRDDGEAWQPVGSLAWPGRVQQNAASILDDDVIHSWGVDVDGAQLVTCAYDLATESGSCGAVAIGGPYATPPSSNYIGAAQTSDPAHLVWFTAVGASGGAGSFVYTYDYGGGYNGPVVTPLPGYNDLGYVHAAFVGPSSAMLVGQAYVGQYPNGSFGALAIEFEFGEPAVFSALFVGGEPVRSGADVWIDPRSGTVHALAETDDGRVAYYVKPADAPWAAHAEAVSTIADTFRARFSAPPTGELALVRGSATDDGIEVRIADPIDSGHAAAIDWEATTRIAIDGLPVGFESPSAIYVESTTYQDQSTGALQFAACGRYSVADGEIWHVALARG